MVTTMKKLILIISIVLLAVPCFAGSGSVAVTLSGTAGATASGPSIVTGNAKSFASTSSATSHSITVDNTPAQNNLMILTVVCDAYLTTYTGWTNQTTTTGEDWVGTYILSKVAGASESKTMTVSIGDSTGCTLGYYEITGATSVDKVAAAIGQGGSSNISTGTTATTTAANEVVIAVVGLNVGNADDVSAWSNGFTQDYNVVTTNGGTQARGVSAHKVVTSTGAQTTTATIGLNTRNHDSGAIVTIK
jgi:hypothetical protein